MHISPDRAQGRMIELEAKGRSGQTIRLDDRAPFLTTFWGTGGVVLELKWNSNVFLIEYISTGNR